MNENKKMRGIRVDESTWAAAQTKAETEGRPLSEVIRIALRDYAVGRYHAKGPKGSR